VNIWAERWMRSGEIPRFQGCPSAGVKAEIAFPWLLHIAQRHCHPSTNQGRKGVRKIPEFLLFCGLDPVIVCHEIPIFSSPLLETTHFAMMKGASEKIYLHAQGQ
jgi:hypothetical protein